MLKKSVESRWSDRRVTIGRAAILTQPHQGRAACHYCGHCDRGCDTHSYFSSVGSTLPAAAKTGRMTLRPNSIAREIIVDTNTGKAKGVRIINQVTKQEEEVFGKAIVLCASTLESTRLLLNSASRQHPQGFGNSSGVVGHYLMDHIYQIAATGTVPVLRGSEYDYSDGRANGIYIPRFRNLKDKRSDYLRGFGLRGAPARDSLTIMPASFPDLVLNSRSSSGRIRTKSTSSLVRGVRCSHGRRIGSRSTAGRSMPGGTNSEDRVCSRRERARDGKGRDRRDPGDGRRRRLPDKRHQHDACPPGFCIHEVGTARMGNDPKTSALNSWNQVWDSKNVFVTDGACFVSQGCQNPTLTMMAITARACDYLADQMKKGEI
jgi:choline dehydrogenase-like flavoprotein